MSQPDPQAPVSVKTDPLLASPYRRQLDSGFRWLRFSRLLEELFQRESFQTIQTWLRFTLLIIASLAVVIIVLDTVLVRVRVTEGFTIWRYGVLLPAILTAFALTFGREAWHRYRIAILLLGPMIMTAATVLVVSV